MGLWLGLGVMMMGKMGRKAIETGLVGELGCGSGPHWEGAVLTGMASLERIARWPLNTTSQTDIIRQSTCGHQ